MRRWSRARRVALAWIGCLALSVLAGCSAPPPQPPAVDRIVVTPSALLFTGNGQTAQLTAQAFDADGNELDVAITWTVRSGPIEVDAGLVTSTSDLGSGLLVAEAQGIASFPVAVLIAEPVAGAITLADDQVVGEPVAVDDPELYDYGWRYRIELRDLPQIPQIGDIVMSRESLPISGRVTEVVDLVETVAVTLAVTEIPELFQRLDYGESMDLDGIRPEVRPEFEDVYRVDRKSDGSFDIVPDDAAVAVQQIGTRALWSDGCSPAEIGANVTLPASPGINYTTNGLRFDLRLDPNTLAFQRFELAGDATMRMLEEIVLKGDITGKLSCTATLGYIPLPLSPPLQLILYPEIGLGLGFDMTAKISTEVRAEYFVEASVHANVGIDCTAACTAIGPDGGAEADFHVKPTLPGVTGGATTYTVETGVAGYASAKLLFGNPLLRLLGYRFEALEIKAGVKATANLQSRDQQAAQDTYGSTLALDLFGEFAVGGGFSKTLGLLKISIAPDLFKKEFTSNLITFPTGTVSVTGPHGGAPPMLVPGNGTTQGDLAEFDVELDNREFFLPVPGFPLPGQVPIDVVENIELFWWKEATLDSGRPPCTTIDSTTTRFTCSASFLEEHVGDNTFYAFVNPQLFGISIPIPLEVGKDGKAELFVDPAPEIPTPPASDVTIVPAETETDVAFAVPFDDLGENIAEIRADFELVGNPIPFSLTWAPTDATAYDFTGASGIGVVGTSMFIYCDQQGNNPINVTFTLTDELDQVSNQDTTSLTVDYSGCSGSAGSATPAEGSASSRSLVVRKAAR